MDFYKQRINELAKQAKKMTEEGCAGVTALEERNNFLLNYIMYLTGNPLIYNELSVITERKMGTNKSSAARVNTLIDIFDHYYEFGTYRRIVRHTEKGFQTAPFIAIVDKEKFGMPKGLRGYLIKEFERNVKDDERVLAKEKEAVEIQKEKAARELVRMLSESLRK